MNWRRMLEVAVLLVVVSLPTGAQEWERREREYEIAARYAPHFYQVVDRRQPRLDYLARFDFDGNWRADDNWANAGNPEIPLPAYVYFSVAETPTHFFIHYICFHPRDWKGNRLTNATLQTFKFVARPLVFPRWLGLDFLSLAHENDLEGVLVVVARDSAAGFEGRTVLAETFSHHRFKAYRVQGQEEAFQTGGRLVQTVEERPMLFIESQGHGLRESLQPKKHQAVVHYRYTGTAEEPGEDFSLPVGYELLPLYETLWQHALASDRSERTFSKFRLYDQFELADFFASQEPRIGTALRGRKRGRNRAAAPWAWKNNGMRGQWFFDPARNVAERHHPQGPFEKEYLFNRFLAVSTHSREPVPANVPQRPAGPALR